MKHKIILLFLIFLNFSCTTNAQNQGIHIQDEQMQKEIEKYRIQQENDMKKIKKDMEKQMQDINKKMNNFEQKGNKIENMLKNDSVPYQEDEERIPEIKSFKDKSEL